MNICARMRSRSRIFIFFFCVWCVIVQAANSNIFSDGEEAGFVVSKESRRTLVSTENGEIVAARVAIGDGSSYHLLHFFTMDPNSLFLPVLLHSHMVFYVHTGSGKLSWTEENELQTTDLRQGDVYRLKEGAVFFIQSNLETTERRKLRINAIFANSNTEPPTPTGPYSSIRDLVLGFDNKVLKAAFKVSEEEIEELLKGAKPPAIIHGVSKSQKIAWEMETKFIGSLLGSRSCNLFQLNKKKGKRSSVKLFNLFKEDKDFENGNGWSTAVTNKKLSVLQDADIGLFMVNLTTGSMMGPHWNPVATEIALVLQGRGMVRVVCSSVSNDTGCKNMRFEVEEGDIFVVPRFHPMAQMAFNNETFVFMGFSTSAKKNHPQYLAGQASVLRTLSKQVLAMSFNVGNTTMDQLLASQHDSVILGCISCAEEELSILEEEREKTREREEERHRKEEEEAAREREEEEAKRQEEERKRQEEEEEAEAERKRREEEEEEEERKQQEEEEEAEEAKREEQERKRHEEEEEEEEEERRRREEEEAARREKEKRERREEEAARREREKRERREEAAERREAKEERRRHEEEMARREEEERQRQEAEEEEERQRQEEEHRQRKEEREEKHGRRRRSEEEEAEEEERRREQEEEREEGERERRLKEE